MTKNILTYAVLALFTLGLNACSQEDDFAPQGEPQEITILTRAANSETFTGDFTLELWNDGVHTTHPMTYTESSGYNLVKVDNFGTTVNALAYCGNTVTVTSPDNYTVELSVDQSTEDAFNAADVMIATGTFNENGVLSLNFKHRFAKVSFQVDLAGEFDNSDKITNFLVMTKNDSSPDVKAYFTESDASYRYDCSAYIPTGTYEAGDTFVIVIIGNNHLVVKMKDVITFAAGTHYTFTLKVGKDKVTITQVSTNNIGNPFDGGWNTDSETDL